MGSKLMKKKYFFIYLLFSIISFFTYAQEPYIEKDSNKIFRHNNKNVCFVKSEDRLPLNKSHRNSKYKQTNMESCQVEDLELWNCEIDFRYIPLPSKNNIDMLLVPIDCGDFPYRLYLITIKDHQIRSELYVEGEWYEPGYNEDMIEKTHFSISKDFIITVTTEYDNKLTIKHYYLNDNGYIEEKNNNN